MRYAWKSGRGGSDRSPGTTLWKPRSTACRGRWPAGCTSGEMANGALHSNPSIVKNCRRWGWPSVWWEYLLHLPPWSLQGNRPIRIWESRRPCRIFGDSFSAGHRSFGPGISWEGWRGVRSYFLSPASEPLTTFTKPSGVSISASLRAGTVYRSGHWSTLPSELFPSSPYLQNGSPQPSFSPNVEARSIDLYL